MLQDKEALDDSRGLKKIGTAKNFNTVLGCNYYYDLVTDAYLRKGQVTLQHVHALCHKGRHLEVSGLMSVSSLENLVFMHPGGHIAADEGSLIFVPIKAPEGQRVVKVRVDTCLAHDSWRPIAFEGPLATYECNGGVELT